jgi:GTP-binding protein
LLADENAAQTVKKSLPKGVPVVMISAVAQKGLQELKETIWGSLASDSF